MYGWVYLVPHVNQKCENIFTLKYSLNVYFLENKENLTEDILELFTTLFLKVAIFIIIFINSVFIR